MHIIKLDATDSTNLHLKKLMFSNTLDDFTIVVAREQSQGKGQMGSKWVSQPGKNLTLSILKKIDEFSITDQFQLNIVVSLAILETLNTIQVPHLKIKWPNDILSGKSKICGILIENMIKGDQIGASIIGIGLNVNQTEFPDLINVSSLKLLLGRTFNLDEILRDLLKNLNNYLKLLGGEEISSLSKSYEEALCGIGKTNTFELPDGASFIGLIKGVSRDGKLQVLSKGNQLMEFGLKEIKQGY